MKNKFDNRDRFTGSASLYHESRPRFPQEALRILLRYLEEKPIDAVDLGCGTGLSTAALAEISETVIGIDPNADMLAQAGSYLSGRSGVHLLCGTAEALPLESESADLIVCSQSFHWMDPETAIPEICRVLRDGGLFATVDYDWPGVYTLDCELAYRALIDQSERIIGQHPEIVGNSHKWSKSKHCENLRRFGTFRYCREIVFASQEDCSGTRFRDMAVSQSGVQAVLKSRFVPELEPYLSALSEAADRSDAYQILLPYRMRIGIR